MVKLELAQLKEVLEWASRQRDAKGRSLLERARQSLLSGSYLKYNTTLEKAEDGVIEYDCNCPAINRGKHKDKPCKHVIAHLILAHENELRRNPRWAEWFEEFHKKQMEDALKAFEAFEDLKEFEDF